MGVLIYSGNFVGKYSIPQGAFSTLDQFITDTEESYLIDLIGATMYADFKANLTPAPPATSTNTPRPTNAGYLNIYNSFNADYGSKIYKSKGLVIMLLGFIFFDFVRQQKYKITTQGIVSQVPDTATEVSVGNLYTYLNEATESYQAIQTYIESIKPELFNTTGLIPFNGQDKSFGISILQ